MTGLTSPALMVLNILSKGTNAHTAAVIVL